MYQKYYSLSNSMDTIALENLEFERLISTLSSGGIVVFPTDTVYGIMGNASDEAAIEKIFSIKKRSPEKAFPVFVKNISEARKLAYISDAKARFLENVWPGPVTVVFHHKEKLPPILTGGADTLGIRIPNHPLLLTVLSRLDFPLVQTSANLSGFAAAKTAAEIANYFRDSEVRPDLIVDGGIVAGVSSTVIDFTGFSARVLRTGVTSKEKLEGLLRSLGE